MSGRRRYVPDWPRNVARTRQRLGRALLLLGVFMVLTVVVTARLGPSGNDGEGFADPDGDREVLALVRGADGRWYDPEPERLVDVGVERVIDGDTLDVRDFSQAVLRVRLFGVNAPERGERCADEATARLVELAGSEVLLLADERLDDPGGRQLRYLFTPAGLSIDATLVAEGLATAWQTDGALREQIVAIEAEARSEGRGCLWSG